MKAPSIEVSRRQAMAGAATLGSWLAFGSQARAAAPPAGTLRIGLAGCPSQGAGELMEDAAQVMDQLRVTVTHVWDANAARAAEYARKRGIAHVVDRPAKMAGSVDGVLVCDHRLLYWHPQIVTPLLEARVPVWVDGALASSMVKARQLIESATRSGAPLMAATVEEFLPLTRLLNRKASELAPITVGMAVVSTKGRPEDQWTGVEGVNFACGIFGAGASKAARIVASTREPNYAITLQYDELKGNRPVHIAVQGLPGGADRAWARLYGNDMIDRGHVFCEEPAEEWVNSFLPAALAMQKMFSTRKPQQDYEYLLAKTRLYLAACKSTATPGGRQAVVAELGDDWELQNPHPNYLSLA